MARRTAPQVHLLNVRVNRVETSIPRARGLCILECSSTASCIEEDGDSIGGRERVHGQRTIRERFQSKLKALVNCRRFRY